MNYTKLYESVKGDTAEHMLAEMFRKSCRDLNVIQYMDLLVAERLQDINKLSKKQKTIGPCRSEVLSDRMSWSLYIKLMTEVLKVDVMTFTVETTKNEIKSSAGIRLKGDRVENI